MGLTPYIAGFALMLGIWNIYAYRASRGIWFWVGTGMVVMSIGVVLLKSWLVSQGEI